MSAPGAGRGRGRARGRGRGGDAARRPGAAPEQTVQVEQPPVSRGRSRGAPPPPEQAAEMAKVTQQVAQMNVGPPAMPPSGRERESKEERQRNMELREAMLNTRPSTALVKEGTAGTPINAFTNFFKLKCRPNFAIYQYNVAYEPEIDSKRLRIILLNTHSQFLGPKAFDGMVLYMPKKLPDTVTKLQAERRSDGAMVTITISLTNELPPDSPSCLHLFNITLKRLFHIIKMEQVGRNYYNLSDAIDIPQHRLELWPGFVTSIMNYENSVLLCADVSFKVLRKETVLDMLAEIYNKNRQNFHDVATKKLVGEIVLTRYNNNTYRIDDIAWDMNPGHSFTLHDGTSTTYVEYYRKHWEKEISDMQQPLIMSQPKKKMGPKGAPQGPVYLLPEFCWLTGLSDEARSDFRIMKDLATHTRVSPQDRCNSLKNFIGKINNNPEAVQHMRDWGLEFEQNLLSMKGRILPPEPIYQGQGNQVKKFTYDPAKADWSRETRGTKLISTVNLDDWMMIFTSRDQGNAQDLMSTLTRVCGPMGMNVQKANMCSLSDDRTDTYLRTIQEQMVPGKTQLVMCILPTNRKDRYDAIKKLCCVDKPVASQIVVGRTISKKNMLMSVATKIGIQLNCKLGGTVWGVEIPLSNLMVIGIDCYHDSLSKGKSVGGFIASLDKNLTRYYSRVTSQVDRMDIVDELKSCVTSALRKYNEVNGQLPERIIVYRDGVGDGQLDVVFTHEVKQFLECFKLINSNYNPKFAMIVVKKRINTRFIHQGNRGLSNPPPGSVFDTEVTRPTWFDFFLVSQAVTQGTVTPTHFNIIHDTTGLKPDHFQRLTYKLCHLYYNWPGTVRVPAPCQYAHKLAFLVGQSIHKSPAAALSDRLYFL